MQKFSCAALGLFLVFGIVATASAAITIDGVITAGEWDGWISVDPSDDATSNHQEMTRWGAKVENSAGTDYLNYFCELGDGQVWTDFHAVATGWPFTAATFPGLWIDADADEGGQPGNTGTFLQKDPQANCADDGKAEWATNHRGIDTDHEVGLINNWSNGAANGLEGEGANGEQLNYWGASDDVGDISISNTAADSNWLSATNVIEARVTVSSFLAAIAANGETVGGGVTVGDYIIVALGTQGINGSGITWGYDVGTPTAIAVDPATKALLPGDFDLDGDVDVSDLGILATNYGNTVAQTWTMGDATRDAAVDVSDLGVLATNYGLSAAATAAVPEPSLLCLLGLGSLAVLMIRRR